MSVERQREHEAQTTSTTSWWATLDAAAQRDPESDINAFWSAVYAANRRLSREIRKTRLVQWHGAA